MFVDHLFVLMRSILLVKDLYNATAIQLIKTETRRTHGLGEINKDPKRYYVAEKDLLYESKRLLVRFADRAVTSHNPVIKSRFKEGEILYLAEPMWLYNRNLLKGGITALDVPHLYHYDMDEKQIAAALELKKAGTWKKISPLFMEQEYGRHFIKIIKIDCEPVQDISDKAVVREGISRTNTDMKPGTLKSMYATLFDKVNSVGTWNQNPYVFVYLFEYLPNFKRRLQK